MNQFLGIIPARYASTRFPGKPLAILGNKPMIQWVYERASSELPHVIVATDDQRIMKTVEDFGGKAVMTSSHHLTGTERCAEALELYQETTGRNFSHVINIQGDEPLLKPEHLSALKNCFRQKETRIATLIQSMESIDDQENPNVVKVVVDLNFRALFFSRSPLPHLRRSPETESGKGHTFYTHIGLYAFRADLLRDLVQLPASPLEKAESLEQLRWLENGFSIQTALSKQASMGVDTPEDLARIARLI